MTSKTVHRRFEGNDSATARAKERVAIKRHTRMVLAEEEETETEEEKAFRIAQEELEAASRAVLDTGVNQNDFGDSNEL